MDWENQAEIKGKDAEKEKLKKSVASRGIPSNESLYLPAHYSPELRSFQDSNEVATRNLWDLEEVVNFVFPKKYQQKYHEDAMAFLLVLTKKITMSGSEIHQFVKESGASKATFYNRVLPRLKRIGIIKVERVTLVAVESKRKYRPMIITLSKTFGNYMAKIGDSWLAAVDDARSRKVRE
ncbi:Uncharacterised protein [Candidatus Gugararchaeum adminiculabundum]|nr:Uncharacterised protein [Candidatus Gugararchaeum adminiculabundum]